MGKRGFAMAADHRLAEANGMSELYSTVSERFTTLRTALNSVSDALFFPTVNTPERLMRQVRDTMWKG